MRTGGKVKLLILALLVSCLLPVSPVAADDPPVIIRVVRGDTLIEICREHLEDPARWPEIAKLNRIRDPQMVRAGEVLLIPVAYLKGEPVDGRVTFVRGEVARLPAGSDDWLPLGPGSRLAEGDRVRTGADGELEFAIDDEILLRLRPETELEVTSARQKGRSYLSCRLRLLIGRVVSKVRRLTGRENHLDITTPSAVSGVRGTEYRLGSDERSLTRCEVLKGLVGVEAGQVGVEVAAGQGTLVRQGEPPAAARPLLQPPRVAEPPALYRSLPLSLEVTGDPRTAYFQTLLALDPEFKAIVGEYRHEPGHPLEVDAVDDGRYFLQSSSADADGLLGLPSSPVSISLRTHPHPPFVERPTDDARYYTDRPDLKWLGVDDAGRYQYQVASAADFREVLYDQVVAGTGAELPPTVPGTYFFRIRSLAGDGFAGNWSDSLAFAIVPPPAAPDFEPPASDERTIQIRWRKVVAAEAYRFQLARERDFENLLLDEQVAEPGAELERLKPAGTYYVRTAAIDAHGRQGAFSPPQALDVEARFPWGMATGLLLALAGILALL